MRLALKIFFILLITVAKAQQAKKYSCTDITKIELAKKEKLSDLIPVPSNCTFKSYEFVCKVHGKPITFTGTKEELSKNILANIDEGSTLYLDIEYSCNSKNKRETHCYKLIKQ
jgi:hypothetical protein